MFQENLAKGIYVSKIINGDIKAVITLTFKLNIET